jgi:hypothetical protein
MAVYIEVCDGIGQGFKKLEPVRKWIDSIAALLRQSEGSGRQPAPRAAATGGSASSLNHLARASHHLSEAAVILTMTSPFEGRGPGSMPISDHPIFSGLENAVEQPRRVTRQHQ